MFIVLEGADASGKTTLAAAVKSQLQRDFPGHTIHEYHKGKPEELSRRWALHEYAVSLENVDVLSRLSIADRWHWGEVTYAPLKRPDTNTDGFGLLGIAGWRWVELFMASRGMTQFWVYQPSNVVKRRIESRGDDFVEVDEVEQIIEYYKTASASTYLTESKVQIPEGLQYVKSIAAAVISMAADRASEVELLAEFPEYIGGPNPILLLVGDKRNEPSDTILPFMPVNGNSGEFLMSSLPERSWRRVGIVNAGDVNGDRLRKLIGVLNHPKVAALGRSAEKIVSDAVSDTERWEVFPHPQHVRRFNNSSKDEYGLALSHYMYSRPEGYIKWTLQRD
jgi:hypothetical protein